MAISPIDLQTLYTQMDKVGKTQLSHQASLQQARETAEQEAKKAAEQWLRMATGDLLLDSGTSIPIKDIIDIRLNEDSE